MFFFILDIFIPKITQKHCESVSIILNCDAVIPNQVRLLQRIPEKTPQVCKKINNRTEFAHLGEILDAAGSCTCLFIYYFILFHI